MSRIYIRKGDISNFAVDAVVNAANPALQPGSGVCGAIFERAGYGQLLHACEKIGGCATGEAVITPGYELPATFIIHTPGPVWHGGNNGERALLRSCYRSCLKLAEEYSIRSIAFPVLSAGIFGYPKEEAWEVAIKACHEMNMKIDIYFVALDDEMIDLGMRTLNRVCEKIIGFDNDPGKYECFSNWFRAEFEYAGRSFSSIETYMMTQKVELFGEYELAQQIAEADDAAEAKRIGRSPMKNFDADLWKKVGYNVVKRGVRAKFNQYPDYKDILLATGNAVIAECNASDSIWGVALAADDERQFDVHCWNGENQLGRILMELRSEFRTGVGDYKVLKEQPALVARNPEYMTAIETYTDTLSEEEKEIFFGALSFDTVEMEKLPQAGFLEMIQEILDI